ncbi:MAG: carbonic anhydrase [Spirochaetota bacterium]
MSHERAASDITAVVKEIIEGNKRYTDKRKKEYFDKFRDTQTPDVTLVACSDSRVQSDIFGEDATNKIFTIRNIGNQIVPVLGSVDYGILHLKTPLLLILGHVHCGAIKASMSNYENESSDIIKELDHLCLPVRGFAGQKGDAEKIWLEAAEMNVDYQVKLAVKRYKNFIDSGKLTVLGAVEDFIDAYGKGHGKVIMTNLNGDNDSGSIKKHSALSGVKNENIFRGK